MPFSSADPAHIFCIVSKTTVVLKSKEKKKEITVCYIQSFCALSYSCTIIFLPYSPKAFIESKGGDNSDAWAEEVEAEVEAATASDDKEKEDSSSKSSSLEQKSKEEEEEEGGESRKSSMKAARKKQV